mmetsp:Transcript_460/g.1162  ORF Transcript_460/g.1162 Transcript_460/m.1162 type:complete len:467 (-) Transcript_460:83-1483(-)
MSLSKSASDPGLRASGSGSLRSAGAGLMGASTTNLYDKMRSEGQFRESFQQIRPAGRSITVPLADSAERDVQPEMYYPLPATPARERRYRRISHEPGEITVHHGLKEQKLPGEEFRYGKRGIKGLTAGETLKAGQLLGVAEYRNSCAESIYESNKKEPLGKPHIRGHDVKMLPEGFGNPSGVPVDIKKVVSPIDQEALSEDARLQYRKTHNNFLPGERISRRYNWPDETREKTFRFGSGEPCPPEGAGMALVLNGDVEDDGVCRKTRLVQKNYEDYRNWQHPKLAQKVYPKQGSPPLATDHQYGVKSGKSDYTAESCIKGYYSLQEQLPDQDLGRCTKPGRRNVTVESRAFGVPSVRTDIPARPPAGRSIADPQAYGDECGAAALLAPQRFDDRGVPDREFLIRRPKEELRLLVENTNVEGVDFDSLWDEAVMLFDDGLPLVSLDAMLYLHSGVIEQRVGDSLATR